MTYMLKTACKAPFPLSHRSCRSCFHLSWRVLSLFFMWDPEVFLPEQERWTLLPSAPTPSPCLALSLCSSARSRWGLDPAAAKPPFLGRKQERQRATHAAFTSPGQASSAEVASWSCWWKLQPRQHKPLPKCLKELRKKAPPSPTCPVKYWFYGTIKQLRDKEIK